MPSSQILPAPQPNQNYVTVSPVAGGFITLADQFFVAPADPQGKRTVPSLTFLITHPGPQNFNGRPIPKSKPFRLMFDLGLRKSQQAYPEILQRHIDGRAPHRLPPGVAAQLLDGGLDPKEIDAVILSHVHYDHHGDPEDFPASQFLVGHGALDVMEHGLGEIASHQHFVPGTLPADRSEEFPDPEVNEGGKWKPMGPFPKVLDLFSDGSVFVVDTPGHLPGHLNLLCRTKAGDQDLEKWYMLCGDAFHDRRLLTGEKAVGTWASADGSGTICIHLDKPAAEESIRRLREFERVLSAQGELVAAHEEEWWEANKSKAFPKTL